MKKNKAHPIASANAFFVLHYAGWIVAAMILLTAVSFPLASKLQLKASFLDLLPSDHPSIRNLKTLTDEVGGTSFLIVVMESTDEESAEEAARLLTEMAPELQDVESVDNRGKSESIQKNQMLFLSLESLHALDAKVKEIIGFYRRKNNPFFVDLLNEEAPDISSWEPEPEAKVSRIGGFSSKEKDTFLRVVLLKPYHPLSEFEKSGRLFRDVEKAAAEIQKQVKYPVTFGLTGPYKTRYDEYMTIKSDLRKTGILTVVLILTLMFLFFRNRRVITIAFISLAAGIIWTCAFADLAVGYINVISGFLLSILVGLGIDFAIHFLVTFETKHKATVNIVRTLEGTYASIGEPSLTSALTTSIAFFSLTISQFQGIRDFGLIAGFGILFCFLVILYGLPSILILSHRFFKLQKFSENWPALKFPKTTRRSIYIILIAGVTLSLTSIYQIPKNRFEYNFKSLQEKGAPAIELAERIGDHFGVVLNPVALITPSHKRASELAGSINHYIEQHPDTTFDFAASIDAHIPKNQEEKVRILQKIDNVLEKQDRVIQTLEGDPADKIRELRDHLKATHFAYADIPEGIHNQYEGKDRDVSIVYVYPLKSIMDGQNAKRFIHELRDLKLPKDVIVSGEPVVYVDILNLLEQDMPRAMLISFCVVIVLLFIHFRSLFSVLWVLSPVLWGFLWMFGLAGLFHFKFNYINMVILPCILGVGIDNGIYIFHRYRIQKKKKFDEIIHMTGKAVILASLTTMAAFASLMTADHQGMATLGTVGFLGFACCLTTSVLFIPAMIEFFELQHWKTLGRDS